MNYGGIIISYWIHKLYSEKTGIMNGWMTLKLFTVRKTCWLLKLVIEGATITGHAWVNNAIKAGAILKQPSVYPRPPD